MDEKAQMWGSWPDRGRIQIQRQETAVRPHRTEVAAQTYHVQVGAAKLDIPPEHDEDINVDLSPYVCQSIQNVNFSGGKKQQLSSVSQNRFCNN